MISLKDIESLTAFKRNTTEYVKKIKKSGNPLVLTVNGKAEIVVQDAESYQRMLEVLDRAETIEALREGLESVRRGKTMSLDQFDKEMRKRIGAPKKR
jgi:prevent-host-death family protein